MRALLGIIFVSLLVCVMGFSCGDSGPSTGGTPGPDLRTPEGSRVVSPVTVPPEVLSAIDVGIDNEIARMKPEWTKYRNHSDYQILFVPAEQLNQFGEPAINVGGTVSAGTV